MSSLFPRASEENIADYKDFIKKDKTRFLEFYGKRLNYKVTLDDFDRMQTLGAGTFGRVVLIQNRSTQKYYALKIQEKKQILEMKQLEHTRSEKQILQALNFPFMVYLECFFQDNSYVYFVLPFVMGGEMFTLLRKMKTFQEDLARFYAAQVCLGLDYLHYLDLVYRDLKPENILVDETGYLKITDFGFCKMIRGRTYTLCGTPEYLAPEIILSKGYGFTVDWWSFGILIFEMNAGYSPFYHKDHMALYGKITAGRYKVPPNFSTSLRELVRSLLQLDISKRIGNLKQGVDDILNHKWFKQINWVSLLNRKTNPPYKPQAKDPKEAGKNFDRYKDEPIRVSPVDHYAREFANF